MKLIAVIIALMAAIPVYAQNLTIDMKLAEVNSDSTQARFFKGEPAYGLSDALGSVVCWGSEGNRINIEIEKTGKIYSAEFASFEECKSLIKKAKGFLGVNYGTIRFILKGKKVSFERI